MGQLSGPTDPAADAHWDINKPRKGFFTDTSICIGCKACEVACKEWNRNPRDGDLELTGMSYDNTVALGASTWRHVAFVEQGHDAIERARESGAALVSLGMPAVRGGGSSETVTAATDTAPPDTPEFRWLMASDVCKHCTHAGCLDVCPTGALFRTEFSTVVVQADVCNGCGTCVAGCPFGVIERRSDGTVEPKTKRGNQNEQQPAAIGANRGGTSAKSAKTQVPNAGIAQKCTLCYDRMVDGQTPACAKTCPTTSIKYGDRADMVAQAKERVAQLHAQGMTEARLYGANDNDGVGGTGSVFLLLDEPEVYGLPPDPRVPTADLPQMFKRAGLAAAGMVAAAALSFVKSSLRGRR
ncbi:4Fe-4S dicluster domain-containing protein [Nakamurella aerolata]|uniref:4Fe-4S dicluster domain-containing protein n=1 Tax=Nakamurella aerolata TaxID=1656892 RepID=A0A849A9D3_9ACTN|nr:4Fe-4S dicluster domain-containing protein [Nakamurella aerolata]NNG36226.1 4Fe-4S dicluster domain-containing protein [Nakamurella aerolata]